LNEEEEKKAREPPLFLSSTLRGWSRWLSDPASQSRRNKRAERKGGLITPPFCNVPATWRPTRPGLHSSTDPTTAWVSQNTLYNASNDEREKYHHTTPLLCSRGTTFFFIKNAPPFYTGRTGYLDGVGGPGPDLRGIAWAGFSDSRPLKQASSHLQQGPPLGTRPTDPNRCGQQPIIIADIYSIAKPAQMSSFIGDLGARRTAADHVGHNRTHLFLLT